MKQAIVNGQPIPGSAVEFELQRLVRFYIQHGIPENEIRKRLPELAEKAREQAIGNKLLLERAIQLDLPVSEAAIDAQVNKIIQQVGGYDKFTKALAAQKMSMDSLRQELVKGCKVDALVHKAVSETPEPSDEEITAYFEAHAADYETGPQVLAQHILITPENRTEESSKQKALEKIKAIRKRITEEGANFSEEARAHSQCPSGKEGGSLGWFGRGAMVKEFDEAAFKMKTGEVSDVIETQFGYHIIYKADEKPGSKRSITEVYDSIKDLLRHEARGRALDAYVAELREKAKIEYREVAETGHTHTHGDGCSCGHNHG